MKRLAIILTAALCSNAVNASDFNDVKKLSQDAFLKLAKDITSVTALRALSPGISLNLLGADIGVELGVSSVNNSDVWKIAGGGSTTVITPRITAHKGFAGGLDIGGSIGTVGTSGISTIGGVLRYAVVDPGVIWPGVTLRLTGSREIGSDTIEVRNVGADVIVAKPLLVITPYIGLGTLRSETRASGTALSSAKVSRSRLFVGFDTQLSFATFSAEAEKTGDVTTVSSKVGFRF